MEPEVVIDRLKAAYGDQQGCRTLHAKGAFYQGTFTATPEATALSSAAHLNGDAVPVLVRWSNGGGNPKVGDSAPDVRGMAVSFRPDNGATTDLLGQTSPMFPIRNETDFVELVEGAANPLKFPLYLATHPRSLVAVPVLGKALKMPYSFAEATYYPIHAYGWIAADGTRSWVRYRFVPQATKADRPVGTFKGRNRLQEEAAARLAAGPVRFDLEIDVAGEGDDPHDPMSKWKNHRTLVGGVIEVTSTLEDPEAGGPPTVFDPARVVPGIELSEDPILLYRPRAYDESVKRRS